MTDAPTASPPLDPRLIRRGAVGAYAVLSLLSLLWGVSYDLFDDRGLEAVVQVGTTTEGATYLSVRNSSPSDWNDVKIEADDFWFLRVPRVPAGTQVDARLDEFENPHRLPRPPGASFFENVGVRREAPYADERFQPRFVTVTADRGSQRAQVAF